MIYFDNASSTQPSEEVLNEYTKACKERYANAGAIHHLGMENFAQIERTKVEILRYLGLKASDYEVIFTSGATESNNLGVQGFLARNGKRFKHILTWECEHHSVIEIFKHLETLGYKVDYIKTTKEGVIDLDDLRGHLDGNPVFCSFMCANNEIGTVNDMKAIRNIIGNDSVLHSDLTQTIGKAKVDLSVLDMFTFSSHKIYGLKGIGILVKKKKTLIDSIVFGGNQEYGYRSGTVDYPGIAAFKVAIKEVLDFHSKDSENIRAIRCYLVNELSKNEEIILHDFPTCCPYILNISLKTKKASVVVEALSNKQIYVNSVSACYSKCEAVSHVILAVTGDMKQASNTIRISIGKYNTLEEAKILVEELNNILKTIRS